MTNRAQWLLKIGTTVWRHTSAGVALVLIVGALVVGYRVGHTQDEPDVSPDMETAQVDAEPQMYTCAMHPSVRLPDKDAKCPICFMDLIPVDDGRGGGGAAGQLVLSEESMKLAQIETSRAVRFFPEREVRLFGKVALDETRIGRLTAYFPSRIERLFVNYVGVTVHEGDHLAEVYSPELLAAFEELRQAQRALDGGESASEVIRSSEERLLVAAREKLRLFGLTHEQIDAIEQGEYEGDTLTIYAPIGGVVMNVDVREGDYVKIGAPIATVADLSRLWLNLESYESQLSFLRWGQSVEFSVEALPGRSFEGKIAFIEPMVNQMTRTAAVRVAVDNSDGQLMPGMFASAIVRTRIGSAGAVMSDALAGKWVSPMHPSIVKDGPGSCDVCGMDLVRAESLVEIGDPDLEVEPIVIPRSAALVTGKRAVVYVRDPDADAPTFEAREIVLGPRAGEFYVVASGLAVGEEIVTHGAFRLDSAMQIAAKPSMMSPSASTQAVDGRLSVPADFLFSLKPLYVAYFDAQEALADDSFDGFNRALKDLAGAIELVDETGLTSEALRVWRRGRGGLASDSTLADIEMARAHFEGMSIAVTELLESFGHFGSDTWHVAFCPMAIDNKGAKWVQRGDVIDNPYFGSAMLQCGEITDEFEPLESRSAPAAPAGHGGHNHE